mgnify:CR=1 FL=1
MTRDFFRSLLEDSSISVEIPMSQVFNGLVVYDQHVRQNSLGTIRPELAESWSWSEDGKTLTFKLRHGVKWHDGKPFTAADVKCTWDLLLGKAKEPLRANPRGMWYWNVNEVTADGDDTATFHLKDPQPALLALLASGFSAIYPCHVSPAAMRRQPIGTGPFKFAEHKQKQSIRLIRNPDYWKPGLPYLDGVEYMIIPNMATAQLTFASGGVDMTFPFTTTLPLLRELKTQDPKAVCEVAPTNTSPHVLINPAAPPFDDFDLRRAVALAIDRQAMIDILSEGKFDMGGTFLPPPEGNWGMPKEQLQSLPGYDQDVKKQRDEARALMRERGYGPDKRLSVKLATRNVQSLRDPAILLIDQLREIWIDAELEVVETAVWLPKLTRQDYQIALSHMGNAVDEPDQNLFEYYVCGGRSYTGYCDKETDALIQQQSREADQEKRKQLVWAIDRRLQEQVVRPVLFWQRAATCWKPELRSAMVNTNSIYNSWRMEDWWLDR